MFFELYTPLAYSLKDDDRSSYHTVIELSQGSCSPKVFYICVVPTGNVQIYELLALRIQSICHRSPAAESGAPLLLRSPRLISLESHNRP